jgi:hypothetical protein
MTHVPTRAGADPGHDEESMAPAGLGEPPEGVAASGR